MSIAHVLGGCIYIPQGPDMTQHKYAIATAIVDAICHAGGPKIPRDGAQVMARCIELTLEPERDVAEVIPAMRFCASIGLPGCFRQLGCAPSEAVVADVVRRAMRLRYAHPRVAVDATKLTLAVTKINMWGEKYSGIGTPTTMAAALRRQLPKATLARLAKLSKRRIAFLGDSLMTTLHWASHAGFPDILSELFRQINPGVTIVNAGIGGNTSVQGLARLERDVLVHRPDMCVVFFGGNDVAGTRNGKDLRPMAKFRTSMREILTRLKRAGVTSVMINGVRGGIVASTLYKREVVAAVEKLAQQTHVPYIDVYSAMAEDDGRSWLSLDDVHLNNVGQLAMATLVAEWLVR